MLIAFLSLLCLLFFAWSVFTTFFLWRFVKIVLNLENDYSAAMDILQSAENSMHESLQMQTFFDAPEVQKAYMESMEGVRVAKMSINGLIGKLTKRSKQKYYVIEDEAEDNS